MRVLFASYAERTPTVFQATVALAWALRTAGHEVRVASQPELTGTITGAGLTAVPVGRNHNLWQVQERFMKRIAQLHPEINEDRVRGGKMPPFDVADDPEDTIEWDYLLSGYKWSVSSWYRMANEPMVADLVAFCRSWKPDLVIWEPGTYAAPIAAKACGAAHARLLWSLDFFGRIREHFLRLKPAGGPDPLADWLGAQAEKYGTSFSEDLTCGQFTIEQLPEALRMSTNLHCVPMRYVPYNGKANVPRWLWEPPQRPRVCLTLGITMAERFGGHAVGLQGLFDSLADLDIELVATLPDSERAKLDRIPANTKVVPFVPLHALVPSCSAVIHHAGFGTLCTTALNGVPQLVLPEHFDEPPFANRLAAQGAALTIPAAEATGSKIRDALVRLLEEPSFGKDALRLAEDMQALPSPNDLVPTLEQLAGV
jgi:glycosyltransferase (activator-dependent family)